MDAGIVGLCLSYAVLLTGQFQWCVRQSAEVENQVSLLLYWNTTTTGVTPNGYMVQNPP